jgi:chemotaxis methyl-accepting protein methylase
MTLTENSKPINVKMTLTENSKPIEEMTLTENSKPLNVNWSRTSEFVDLLNYIKSSPYYYEAFLSTIISQDTWSFRTILFPYWKKKLWYIIDTIKIWSRKK